MYRSQSLTRVLAASVVFALLLTIGDNIQAHSFSEAREGGVSNNENSKYSYLLFNKDEIECLAKNIYFEAGIESTKGKLAVGLVTLNRLDSELYPKSICKVVHQARYWRGNVVRSRCQFSWFCDGKSDSPKQGEEWVASLDAARRALITSENKDFTDGATHYHAKYVKPGWARSKKLIRIARIGDHIFYRHLNA